VGVNGDQSRIGGNQRGFCFGDEGGISRQVEEIYFNVAAFAERAGPLGVSEAGLNRYLSRNFFFVPIRGGAVLRRW
jgi:hypothetical protein